MATGPRSRSLALASLLGFALLAAAEQGAAPGPPNGTYTYALSRDGTDQGKTTITVFRREGENALEIDEAGAVGAARAHVIASYHANDLSLDSYVATYQAPFLRSSALGRVARYRPKAGFYDQTTVRYHVDDSRALDTVDGVAGERVLRPAGTSGPLRDAWILDAPFMAGALLLPAFRHHANLASLVTLADAFGDGADAANAKVERIAPRFPKTPKSDVVLDVEGVAFLWFDPATLVVHEAHFDGLNLDARLLTYTKAAEPAPFEPAPTPSPSPALQATQLTFDSADGTTLAGEIDFPANGKHTVPAIVFVPPGPSAGRSFGGDGPEPMFPGLAALFTARGYAVLRYDTRGVGKSGGASATQTWEQARADAVAALAAAASGDYGTDPKRVYILGYGNGADLAMAAALQSDVPVAGAIALGPTVTSYHACETPPPDEPLWIDGKPVDPSDGSWRKSANGHDPGALAARLHIPLFVLQPGVPICKESADQRDAYDEKLQAGDPLATIVVASDLSERFGGRYDADSPADSEAIFPYRFDASTAGAIADWLDNPKTAGSAPHLPAQSGAGAHPPPPPPQIDHDPDANGGLPKAHPATAPPTPRPAQSVEPGVVLPSGMTPPP
jgi:alpha/beta superfamily hydrolase